MIRSPVAVKQANLVPDSLNFMSIIGDWLKLTLPASLEMHQR